jgi:hypothetical protein
MQANKKPVLRGVRIGWTITVVSLVVIIFAITEFIIVKRSDMGNDPDSVGTQIALITLLFSLGLSGLIAGPIITVTRRREAHEIDEIRTGQNMLAPGRMRRTSGVVISGRSLPARGSISYL